MDECEYRPYVTLRSNVHGSHIHVGNILSRRIRCHGDARPGGKLFQCISSKYHIFYHSLS